MKASYTKEKEKPLNIRDSGQPRTITSGSKGNNGRYPLDSPPEADSTLSRPDIVGMRYGHVEIMDSRVLVVKRHPYVAVKCTGCGNAKWISLENLKSGKSKGCQACSQRRQVPEWLSKRLMAAKQRCENPNVRNWMDYGGRGIRFRFASVQEAGLYVIQEMGIPPREMELDRIDTDGDYARGNRRFVTHKENNRNKRNTVLSEYNPIYWPYSHVRVVKMLSEGMSREEIIRKAETSVMERRKNWRTISARLDFMTYEMPDRITVLPYRGTSCTTADTEEGQER